MPGPYSLGFRRAHPLLALVLLVAPVLLWLGCGEGGQEVEVPSLEVRTRTSGTELDPDGYSAGVDGGQPQAIGLTDTLFIDPVADGPHSVLLAGLSANCTVTGDNPVSTTVAPGRTAVVAFTVTCGPTSGSLVVTTSTSGSEPDPDGYVLTLDGGAGQPIGSTATLTLPGLSADAHTVALGDVAGNCTVGGDNPLTVTLGTGQTVEVTFAVTCVATTGSLAVTTATTGTQPDPDGYTFVLDGTDLGGIGVNTTRTLETLPAGAHEIELRGIAANCALEGENPRPVTLAPGTINAIAFQVNCPPAGLITWIRQAIGGIFCHCGIYTMSPDGSEQTPLLISVGDQLEFEWSPSGDKLAFTGDSQACVDELNHDIFVATADGSGWTRLTPTPAASEPCDGAPSETTPSWSPDGTRIAFTRTMPGYQLWVMQADGTGQTELAPGRSPRWSPVRDVIAFVGENGRLHRINADGSDSRPLSSVPVASPQPVVVAQDISLVPIAWSPDGSRLAFVGATTSRDQRQVFIVNEDGSGETALTVGESPAWSPDGSRLAFVRNGNLYRILPDGSDETFLAEGILPGSAPAWSPSGSRLAAIKRAPQGIWVLKADGTDQVQLTNPGDEDMRDFVVNWRP